MAKGRKEGKKRRGKKKKESKRRKSILVTCSSYLVTLQGERTHRHSVDHIPSLCPKNKGNFKK